MAKTVILGIESSCDDTSAAVIADGILLSNVIASQSVHEEFGGVVPELASRAHQQNIVPVVDTALRRAGICRHDLSAIAFTRGPGLLGSLLVGTSFAKGMATGLGIPLVDVNHLHGHVLSHFVRENPDDAVPEFPYLCLLVSGGNSQLIWVKSPADMEILGRTIDDAAGEAFDKCAKVMGLPYPGGPHIDRLAAEGGQRWAQTFLESLFIHDPSISHDSFSLALPASLNHGTCKEKKTGHSFRNPFHEANDSTRFFIWRSYLPDSNPLTNQSICESFFIHHFLRIDQKLAVFRFFFRNLEVWSTKERRLNRICL